MINALLFKKILLCKYSFFIHSAYWPKISFIRPMDNDVFQTSSQLDIIYSYKINNCIPPIRNLTWSFINCSLNQEHCYSFAWFDIFAFILHHLFLETNRFCQDSRRITLLRVARRHLTLRVWKPCSKGSHQTRKDWK